MNQNLKVIKGQSANKWIIWLPVIVILAVVIGINAIGPYCDYLWFLDDARYPLAFTLQYSARGELFIASFAISLIALYFGSRPLVNLVAVYSDDSIIHQQPGLKLLLNGLESAGELIAKLFSFIVAVFLAIGFSENWKNFLVFLHSQPFGRIDPVFGFDDGFYVFKLPFLGEVFGFLFWLLLVTSALAIGSSALPQLVGKVSGAQIVQKYKVNPSFLLGGLIAILGVNIYLVALGSLADSNTQFVGPGYAGIFEIRTEQILAWLCIFFALAIVSVGFRRVPSKKVLVTGFGLLAFWAVVVTGILPSLVESFHVDPDRINVEKPFAERAIQATRYGFGLDNLQTITQTVTDSPTAQEVTDAKSTFSNMRLWDPFVLEDIMNAAQSLRPYYSFNDVDIDRYMVPDSKTGKMAEKMVMLSAREINTAGLSASANTWVNKRLEFTHGYGVVAAEVNKANALGQPVYLSHDMPVQAIPALNETRPQIYFGDGPEHYAIVDTRVDEIDYPTQDGSATNRWAGDRGIPIGTFFTKLLFALDLGDTNILISDNIRSHSRLLLRRNIIDRASAVYPFLHFDSDPYLVIVSGKLYWILDGYTTSDRLPYSDKQLVNFGEVNYIRNSVKIVINANSGKMMAFEMDPRDPILKTYESIYPHLIHPLSEVPPGIKAHFRYPEDIFQLQTQVLTIYHVTDPVLFLDNGDAWSIANERDLQGNKAKIKPYYVLIRLPDEPADEFLLIRPFTPFGRDNMTGWLAAHCDGNRYGILTLYKFPKGTNVNGPAQEENLFVQDNDIANINRNMNNDQSELVVGDLLVIPVGKSIVYAESLFLKSKTSGIQSIPELRFVILATKSNIVVGNSYHDAYEKLFGSVGSPPASLANPSEPGTNQSTSSNVSPLSVNSFGSVPTDQVKTVLQYLDEADKALRSGNFGLYGQLEGKAREQLNRILQSNSTKKTSK